MATKQDIKELRDDMQKMEYRLVIKIGTIVSLSVAAPVAILGIMMKRM